MKKCSSHFEKKNPFNSFSDPGSGNWMYFSVDFHCEWTTKSSTHALLGSEASKMMMGSMAGSWLVVVP